MKIKIHKKLAKSISYGGRRSKNSIRYIVIHYTGNKGDTAKGNATYFATSNTRKAGAHFFVDKSGEIYKSVNMNRIAWAVGGKYSFSGSAGLYYKKCTNTNSVSIELCDCVTGINWEQMKAVRELVKYIRKHCPNARTIIRHWDVNGKNCPASMCGGGNKQWTRLHSFLENGYQYKADVIKKAAVRTERKVDASNKVGKMLPRETVYIVREVEEWGLLKKKTPDGKNRWISLKKINPII